MSQRMQSFVCDAELDPFNVVEPGKRPRVTLTPTLALKDAGLSLVCCAGWRYTGAKSVAVFLNVVEFGMTVQEATEAGNVNTDQLWLSLGGVKNADRKPRAGRLLLNNDTPSWVRKELARKGYILSYADRTQARKCYLFRLEAQNLLGR